MSVGAVYEGCIPQALGVLGKSAPFGSDESVHAAPESFIQRPVKQFRLATTGRTQDRLPKSDIAAPRIGQNGPVQADMTTYQGADLRVCVELRGFEPLTPSMRTERSGLQYRCLTTLPHVRAFG